MYALWLAHDGSDDYTAPTLPSDNQKRGNDDADAPSPADGESFDFFCGSTRL